MVPTTHTQTEEGKKPSGKEVTEKKPRDRLARKCMYSVTHLLSGLEVVCVWRPILIEIFPLVSLAPNLENRNKFPINQYKREKEIKQEYHKNWRGKKPPKTTNLWPPNGFKKW